MKKSLTECLGEKGRTRVLTGSSRHNTGFAGDLLEFYKPVYAVCYPTIILLHHMVFPRISQHQTGRQEKTRTPIHHNYECLLEERNHLTTGVNFNDCCVLCWVTSVMSHSLWPHGLVARQGPLSMGFSRHEYWSGLPWPPSGDLPDPGIEPASP